MAVYGDCLLSCRRSAERGHLIPESTVIGVSSFRHTCSRSQVRQYPSHVLLYDTWFPLCFFFFLPIFGFCHLPHWPPSSTTTS